MQKSRSQSVIEIPAELPPDGGPVWYFPGARDHGHADIIARVHRRDGSSWIASLTRSDWMFGTMEDAFVMPCGERVFLCGGVADRDHPESWRPLHVRPSAHASWSPDRAAVVFCDGLSIEVFGLHGPLWHAVDVAEMGVDAVTPDTIVCSLYDPALGGYVERRFDLITGAVTT